MKKIELFVCETCNTQYASSDAAKKCEKSHRQPKSIKNPKFRPFTTTNGFGYPDKLTIVFDDDKEIMYHI